MRSRYLKDISLTKRAKLRIDEIKAENTNIFIRIMITEGGCAGKQYYILMDDYIGETDYFLKRKFKNKYYIYVVIDENSLTLLHNSTIDYDDGLDFSGFKINNPNALSTCNCGNSFNCTGGFVVKDEKCNN